MSRIICLALVLLSSLSTVSGEDSTVEIPSIPKPDYMTAYTDPVFKSQVTRVTGDPGTLIKNLDARWDKVARHGYSKESAWNCDQSLLLLRQHHGFPAMIFLDGTNYEPVFGRNNIPGTEARWMPNEPDEMIYVTANIIGRWNVRTETTTIVAEFPGYSDFHIGPWEGNLSLDGNRIAIYATKDREKVAFAYDFKTKQKYPDLTFKNFTPDWVSISASGKYLITNGKFEGDKGDQTQVFNLDGTPVGKPWREYGRPSHFDLTLDQNGADIAVGVSKSKPDTGRVIQRRLSDGEVTILTAGGFAGHTSTRNVQRPDWAYITYQYRGPNWPPYRDEVVAVKLDGSMTVERIAHLHSKRVDYLTEAHAVPSPDGKRVLWASSWESEAGRPVGVFIAKQK